MQKKSRILRENICYTHNVSNQTESEAAAVGRWQHKQDMDGRCKICFQTALEISIGKKHFDDVKPFRQTVFDHFVGVAYVAF